MLPICTIFSHLFPRWKIQEYFTIIPWRKDKHIFLSAKLLRISGEDAPVNKNSMSRYVSFCFWSCPPATHNTNRLGNSMHTLDSEVQCVELEIFFGLDEDYPRDIAAGVVVFFFGLDVDDKIGIPRIWISHLKLIIKKAAVSLSNHPPVCFPHLKHMYQ